MFKREQNPAEAEGMFRDEAGQAEGNDKPHSERYGETTTLTAELEFAQQPALFKTLLIRSRHWEEQDELQTCGKASNDPMTSSNADPQ